jgi:flavin reductase (DIM6/NTAB) family NADH-FMN oxidoreductase RutF
VTRPQLSAAFKAAMRRHPVGVTIVTSLRGDEPRGLTLSSFTSVSTDPPAVLICVNRDARSYLYISESRIFCVNLLAAQQRELAQRFASGMRDRQFDGIAYTSDITGAPVLGGTVGHFDCEVTHEHHAGSHSVFLGHVLSCESHPGNPLGYYEGGFYDFALHGVS